MYVRALISDKVRPVHCIACHQTVDDAVNLMAAEKVSALVVTESGNPIGIFAERDVFKSYVKQSATGISQIPVKDAMSHKLIAAKPEDDIRTVIALMIQTDIKHLPVMEQDKIIGMLTLNDLIEYQIENLTTELQHLQEYIADLHEAGHD